jgi:hypothetical protein
VPSYLIETYLARGQAGERTRREQRARSAAQQLAGSQVVVQFERSIYVPEDETCFFIVDAPRAGMRRSSPSEPGSIPSGSWRRRRPSERREVGTTRDRSGIA